MDRKVPRVVIQGNLIKAVDVSSKRGNPEPVIRGEVKGFSKASRKRMIEQCAKMGKAVPIFVTLTYGKNFPDDPAIWKKHLHSWGKRLIRKDSNLCAIWRLEPQKRGAPHFHLLVYQTSRKKPFIPKEWIANSWAEVLDQYSDEDHRKAGTRVESLRSSRGAAFYCAKYCAKLPEDGDFPESWERAGRLWGSFNKKALKETEAPQKEMVLHSSMEQAATLFAMKDAYKKSFVTRVAAEYVREDADSAPYAFEMAEQAWNEAVSDNEYLGNTSTFYGDATEFMKLLSAKIMSLEMLLAKKMDRDPDYSVVDNIASAF